MIIPSVSLAQVYVAALTAGPVVSVNAPAPEIDPARVTPGLGGFLTFFALALAAWFLYRSFAVHMRRIDVRARLQAEEDARRAAEAGGADLTAKGSQNDDPDVGGRSGGPATEGPEVAPTSADGGPAVRS